MSHRPDLKDAPWRNVVDARYDHEETLECGHKWHKPLCDTIATHAKKRRCMDCLRGEVAP